MILYHCSSKKIIKEIKEDGLFWGIFANSEPQTSHGKFITEFDILDKDIATSWVLNYMTDYELVEEAFNKISSTLENVTTKEKILNAALNDDFDLLEINFDGELSWELQRVRGQIAKNLGFKAVEMNDEYCVSYLIVKI